MAYKEEKIGPKRRKPIARTASLINVALKVSKAYRCPVHAEAFSARDQRKHPANANVYPKTRRVVLITRPRAWYWFYVTIPGVFFP